MFSNLLTWEQKLFEMCYKILQTAFSVFIALLTQFTHFFFCKNCLELVASKICRYYISVYNVTLHTETGNANNVQ
jgi:hypothetical protein